MAQIDFNALHYSPTWSMEWRHICEVHHVVTLRKESQGRAYGYLELIEAKRGKGAADKLRNDATELFKKGIV